MAFRKKREYCKFKEEEIVALCGEFALDEAMDLS
jgi:hypothetical protein